LDGKIGIYIHIPFCRRKCCYCDFVSYSSSDGENGLFDAYISAVENEFRHRQEKIKDKKIATIYIGGGTPSILSEDLIQRLFDILRNRVNISSDTEITFECNPESITKEKLSVLKNCGVNRLSIGVQSFNDEVLHYLGRIHNSNEAESKIKLARDCGFENTNIDLIFGIPGFGIDVWRYDIEKALSLEPQHISVYALMIEKDTDFYRRGIAISDDLQSKMYEYARKELKAAGYIHYEISNFARRETFECRHNLNYWRRGEYLGLGVSAASYLKGKRFKNTSSLQKYLNSSSESCIVTEEENIDEQLALSEKFFLGLRLLEEGITIGNNDEKIYGAKIRQMSEDGLLIREGRKIRISPRFIFTSNYILSEFV